MKRRLAVAIELNHTIVPARDKVAAARWFARFLGLPFDDDAVTHFAPVRVNDSLTMDFADSAEIESHHYAFKVSEADFDAIFGRLQAEGIPYGSGPPNPFDDMKINHRGGGRGVYFRDPDGHVLELLTVG
jgi:catechol 2,3-dioxygenase-like lactoylglutathione lyase family enzyme